jgi:formate/nitrite transporter FocA (FNT family)
MKYLKVLVSGVLAGLFIGLGSFAFVGCLSIDPTIGKIIGSALFSVGLFCVCFFGVCLYTGRIGFCFEQKGNYFLDLVLMLAGNFIGAAGAGSLVCLALHGTDNKILANCVSIAQSRAIQLADGATGEPWYRALIMSILCGMLVFLAVYIWKKAENWGIKAAGLILCVWTFVVTGTEHCIANMFYYAAAWQWNWGNFLNVVICIVGNSVGAWALWGLFKLLDPLFPKANVTK